MSLKPGDIVTDEPTAVGTVVSDRQADRWTLFRSGWCCCDERESCTTPVRWSGVAAWGPITLISLPEPTTAPAGDAAAELRAATPAQAEEWEPVTADQVRVGDHIKITREWPEGRFVASGTVTKLTDGWVAIGPKHSYYLVDNSGAHTSSTIRRRPRQPMPEPDAPAVVRHAGRIWVRQEMFSADPVADARPWWPLSLGGDNRSEWLRWADVLALDPATDPVVVDLGGGEA